MKPTGHALVPTLPPPSRTPLPLPSGLPGRDDAERVLATLLEGVAGDAAVAVLCVELSDLRSINEVWGRGAGDAVLAAAAEQLRDAAQAPDRLARLSGDKFLLLLHPAPGPSQLAWRAEALAARLERAVRHDGQELVCRVRIGAACGGGEDGTPVPRAADLLAYARIALDDDDPGCRRRYLPYRPGTAERRRRAHALGQALRHAVAQRELHLVYQPQLALRGERRPRAEALLRWNHPAFGPVSPAEFVPIAENNGLILPIGRLALLAACRQAARWAAGPLGTVDVSVNVSPIQFTYPEIYDEVCLVLEQARLDPASLTLEITEGLLVRDVEATARTIERLKSAGVRISIDDFGAGHSSLAYLAGFAVDELKLDRCFLGGCPGETPGRLIAGSVVALAHRLGIEVVAEGVEDAGQLAALERIGCDRIQGFHHARPMPAIELERFWLSRRHPPGCRLPPVIAEAAHRHPVAG
ncbi:putative bifunctional diguanylate cyclase/phosphodiesterase [Geminicoccus roseus]|uniref:putative bifunctional diguanylate cyclase/phosphodiesterase n=1 Tax=Geminicoccus roseus TaxID=404900 RepID=UPI00041EF822|nr:bifunctional diguanylate cyclase/phosphodiesterase [Geminicoccus roseus]